MIPYLVWALVVLLAVVGAYYLRRSPLSPFLFEVVTTAIGLALLYWLLKILNLL
jgi:hypothetical protein